MSEILARLSLRKEHLRKLHDKIAPAKQRGIWRKVDSSSNISDTATLYYLVDIQVPVLVSINTEDRIFVVDSEASTHMFLARRT